MFRLQTQPHVRPRKAALIPRLATRLQRPEICDLFQMRRPVLYMRVEDRAEQVVLPHVGVKRLDEFQDAVVATESFVEGLV